MPEYGGTGMAPKYVGWSTAQRMEEGIKLHLDDGWTQAAAARFVGVSRPRLNINVAERKRRIAEAAERSAENKAARNAAFAQLPEPEPLVEPQSPEPNPVDGLVDGGVELGPPAPSSPVVPPDLQAPEGGLRERRRVPPPTEFVRKYFGWRVCPDCGVPHERIPAHDEILTKMTDPNVRRLLVNIFPYASKTTCGTLDSTLYEIVRDPNSRTGIVSKTEKLAGRILYQIKRHLTDPQIYGDGPNLIDDWGPFFNQGNWGARSIYVAGRQSAEKDPTVQIYGVGTQIYGDRLDRIVFDDIADMENQLSPDRVARMLQWCIQEAGSRVGKTGGLYFLGTRVGPGDVYSELEKLPAFQVVRYPCILDEVAQTVLWPEHFPYKAAVEMRNSMSTEQFSLVYQNTALPGMGAAFPLDVLEACKDPERFLGHWLPEWRLVLGLDPAGAGEQAGFTAIVVWGVDPNTGKRYLVDMVNVRQMRAPQIKDQVIDFADRYPIAEAWVEVNGLQSQIFQYDVELINKLTQRGIRFVPHITGRNKIDPQFGVESMGPAFYNRMVSLPWADLNSRNKVQQLIDQLAQFPIGLVSDLVMSSWFAWRGMRELEQRYRLPAFDARPNLPERILNRRRVVDFANGVRRPNEDEIANPFDQPAREVKYVNIAGGVSVR